jgi:hypothetical protein
MALSPQLLQFKSSGVYRLEFDKSQTVNIPAETIRLVVGHSKKGPYNSPVLVDSVEQFINVFGSIDRNLEKKGMFFHRSALTALTRGPILALNLAKFDSADLISYAAPITDATDALATAIENDDEYSKFFNTEKFWTPSDEALNSVIGTAVSTNVLRFANIKQDPITVIVRKAQDVKPFNITAREWYGEGNVPSYLNDFDYMSDFMVDVFVFKGGFDPALMDVDPIYGEFFTSTGLEKAKLAEFANLRQVSLIAQYSGSLLPGFVDLEGNQMYVETIINAEARRTGLFCAVQEDLVLEEAGTVLDLVGHDGNSNEVLSYSLTAGDRDVVVGSDWTYTAGSNTASFFFDEADLVANGGTVVAFPDFDLKVGDYIDADATGRLAKVTRIIKSTTPPSTSPTVYGTTTYTVYVHTTPAAVFGGAYTSYEVAASEYVPFVLEGAVIGTQSILDCLDAVNVGTNLGNALTDKDNITYRYIVDTFGSYDTGALLNKSQLSNLAKTRQNASAILNAPMISEFKASTNPSFTDANGAFDVNYVATGGNLDKNPSALYALPGINDGANYAFYYGPGLTVRENNKDIIVPPAAYVSNNFIDKYTDSLPWAIVAGPRRGVVSGSGVVGAEYAFDKSDRDVLEPFGYNPIVFQRGVGLTILGNKTAQQSIQSALSSAHVREVLIYIQDGLAAILKDYVFEFNTAQTRLEIKTLADSFMESVKADYGVYDYKNVMDTSNNTNDVIDANMGIIDTYVEPVKGLEIVVHRTTVLNTGEISTGNFS